MALLGGRRYRRRKKEELFIEGYRIDQADVLTPGLDRTDETFHIYGNDSPETDVQHNYGTLTVGILDKYTANPILDLATQQDPEATGPRQYRVTDLQSIDVFVNIKNEDNSSYVKSYYFEGWGPGMPVPSGDPNAKAAYQVSGNAGLPRQFQGLWITSEKVASGPSAALANTPVLVPLDNVYAVTVKVVKGTGATFEQERLSVSATMVDAAGNVDFTEIDGLAEMTGITHAFVIYLQSGSGVYPTVSPEGLYS